MGPILRGYDHYGADFARSQAPSTAAECSNLCCSTQECTAWTWGPPGASSVWPDCPLLDLPCCFLKSGAAPALIDNSAFSTGARVPPSG